MGKQPSIEHTGPQPRTCAMALLLALILTTTTARAEEGEITGCHDGDTCTLETEGHAAKVRVFCIDAPELNQKPWGEAARQAINAEVHGTIRVLVDSMDHWGRYVAELVRDDGWNLGLELVRAGYAAVYPKYCTEPLYYTAEDQARAAKRGIWKEDGEQQRPWEWRQ